MPSPTSMNPYPLAALNHLTLPSGITNLLLRNPQPGSRASSDGTECPAKATILRPSRSEVMQELCQKGGSSRFRGKNFGNLLQTDLTGGQVPPHGEEIAE